MQISSRNYLSLKGLSSLQASQREKIANEIPRLQDLSNEKPNKEIPFKISQKEIPSEESAKLRAENTRGLGNRIAGASSIESDLSVYEKYPGLDPQEDSLASYSATDPAPSTEDLRQLRGAIEDVTKRFLRTNPNTSTDDLKTELDNHFGSGFSDIIGIDQVDLGNGNSEIQIQQFNYSDLDNEEKAVLGRAVALTKNNFTEPEFTRELKGSDIEAKLNQLELTLGISSKPFIADLRNLLQGSVVDESLENFKNSFKDSEKIISSLKKQDENNIASFNRNPFAEDLRIRFRSGRYDSARSPDKIETVGSLTAD